jgi:hypothetical protein
MSVLRNLFSILFQINNPFSFLYIIYLFQKDKTIYRYKMGILKNFEGDGHENEHIDPVIQIAPLIHVK